MNFSKILLSSFLAVSSLNLNLQAQDATAGNKENAPAVLSAEQEEKEVQETMTTIKNTPTVRNFIPKNKVWTEEEKARAEKSPLMYGELVLDDGYNSPHLATSYGNFMTAIFDEKDGSENPMKIHFVRRGPNHLELFMGPGGFSRVNIQFDEAAFARLLVHQKHQMKDFKIDGTGTILTPEGNPVFTFANTEQQAAYTESFYNHLYTGPNPQWPYQSSTTTGYPGGLVKFIIERMSVDHNPKISISESKEAGMAAAAQQKVEHAVEAADQVDSADLLKK